MKEIIIKNTELGAEFSGSYFLYILHLYLMVIVLIY